MKVKLLVLGGKSKRREIPLPSTLFVIGRGPRCHLRPHCQLVSRVHCAIARWQGRVLVRDLKSANGTYVNGRRVAGEVAVGDGDVLAVGKLRFAFQITGEPLLVHQDVDEGDVRWLIDSPADESVLDPSTHTCIRPASQARAADNDFRDDHDPEALPAGSGALSAGEYLRDYLRLRKDPLSSGQ